MVVRPRGLGPAIAAAGFYAVFVPAVVSEHTTSLEAVGSVCLLGSVALLTRGRDRSSGSVVPLLAAGALLGVATGTKIWGVAVVLALVAWSARHRGVRRAALVLTGAIGGTVVVCLPFFLGAPGPMWRMVVLDQLGRRRVPVSLGTRYLDVTGFSELRGTVSTPVLVVLSLVLLAVVLVLAVRDPLGRLAALLLVATGAVLLSTPPWSVAYTGLAAPAFALLTGCAASRVGALRAHLRPVAAGALTAGLLAYGAASLPGLTFGNHFPGRSLERVLAQAPGCVTTDDPIALIETGALQRNLALGCPVVIDPSGYSYDLQPAAGRHVSRPKNAQWQRYIRRQLGSGATTVVVRFRSSTGLSSWTRAAIAAWPVLADVAGYELRRPVPRTLPPIR